MDPELLDLLSRLDSEDNPLTDDELVSLQVQITEIVREIDPAVATDDDIALMTEARDQTARIREVSTARAEARATREAAARELLADIIPIEPEPEAPPAAEAAAEDDRPAVPPEPEAAPEVPPVAEDGQPAPTEIVPVAASGAPTRLPSISHLARTRPRSARPTETATHNESRRPVLVAASDLPGVAAGLPIDLEQWAHAARSRIDAVRMGANAGADGEKIYFGSVRVEYPDERFLDGNERANQGKIDAVVNPAALAASGGICGPVGVDYSLTTIAQADRPLKGAMAHFGADRGGVRYILPHTLAQVTADAPVSIWTAATDANPGAAVKPYATYVCQTPQEATVDAVVSYAKFGNFQSRYFPEQIAQYMATVDANHARVAEATLLQQMTLGSTAVSAAHDLLGAARDLLPAVDRAVAAYRYRHRMRPESPLRFVYPEWLEDMLRADLARELPGDSGGPRERLATTDAEIANWFAVRNVNTTTVQDSPTGANPTQGWGTQGVGELLPWPLKVICWLYHEGAWTFLDGGELNLGMVRDSVGNAKNDFWMFSETFEKAVFRGHESQVLTFDLAPTGMSAGTVNTQALSGSGS